MKKTILSLSALVAMAFIACQKSNSDSEISLTPSTTQAVVGQTVSVSLATTANVSNWTVSPSSAVTQSYGLTTSKVNYFTFSQPGVYRISVRARSVAYDSTRQSLSAAWTAGGGSKGSCKNGIDSASVAITVTGK